MKGDDLAVPRDRGLRLARNYKALRLQASAMAVTAGRQARIAHAEARMMQEVAQALLGPDAWAGLLDEAVRPAPPDGARSNVGQGGG